MTKTVNAIYEDGVFKPVKKIRLPEHEQFRLSISPIEEEKDLIKKTVAMQKRALKKLIGMGRSGSSDGSVNHDKYLYTKGR
jgi:predicted DNA-binding antitoxin AbrB/MazE fold protein